MISWGLAKGERLQLLQLIGLFLAFAGLVLLVLPGLTAPPLGGSALMLSAGLAWGIYSLRGKMVGDAISATTGNFMRAVPFAIALSGLFLPSAAVDQTGLVYSVASGAIASGVGYVVWYTVLPALKSAAAATVQLSVPILAAAGGILMLGEPVTLRFLLASAAVLGGIALVTTGRFASAGVTSKSVN